MDVLQACRNVVELNIYTDGSCYNNGAPEALAGIGVWIEERPYDSISEVVPPTYVQTNQVAELMAVLRAVQCVENVSRATIYSDSQYAVSSVNTWYYNWKANDWKTSKKATPANLDLVAEVREHMDRAIENGITITLVKVRAHNSIYGNEQAHNLANEAVSRHSSRMTHHAVDVIQFVTQECDRMMESSSVASDTSCTTGSVSIGATTPTTPSPLRTRNTQHCPEACDEILECIDMIIHAGTVLSKNRELIRDRMR
jgi:ribonuclease HI